jgi:2-dehydropantoate 2-reductase
MGAGAIGGFIGAQLVEAGHDVVFVARGQHLVEIQQHDLRVKGPAGERLIKPQIASDNPAEIGPVDLVFLCVKSYDVPHAAKMLPPVMEPQTVVIPVQNGIGHIDELVSALGAEHVLGGMVLICAEVFQPGTVHHQISPDTIEFGEIAGGHSPYCQMLQQVLAESGLNAFVYACLKPFVHGTPQQFADPHHAHKE